MALRDSLLGGRLPNIEIKERMRRLIARHILSYIYGVGQNISQNKTAATAGIGTSVLGISVLTGLLPEQYLVVAPLAGTATTQLTLGSFEEPDSPEQEFGTIQPDRKAVVYCRVSTSEQADDGSGLEGQLRKALEIAETNDIEVDEERDVIKEKGESGRDFERPGLQKLLRRAQDDEITDVIIENTDRLGRRAPQTLSMIDLIQSECDVTIVTSKGEMDTTRADGLALAALQTIISDIENRNRATRVLRGRIESFRNRNWTAWYRKPPFGYTDDGWDDDEDDDEDDDDDDSDDTDETEEKWLEKDDKEAGIVKRMFNFFVYETGTDRPYKKIEEEFNDELDEPLSRAQIKRILQDPVYIGRPTASGETIGDEGQEGIVEDPDLQIISEELYERSCRKVDRVHDQHSGNVSDEALDLEALLAEYGVEAVTSIADCVQLRCPKTSCDGQLTRNGQRTLEGELIGTDEDKEVFNYTCSECGLQKKFPNQWEWYRLHHEWGSTAPKSNK